MSFSSRSSWSLHEGGDGFDTVWQDNLLDMLWKQRVDQSPFCDVTITVQGKVLKAHWCVLVSCPYFESLYSSKMMERSSGEVDLSFSDFETVEFVLRFIYTGNNQFSSTVHNAEGVLKLTDYLQLERLKDDCERQLRKPEITTDTCLHLCTLAGLYNLETLYKKALDVLYANFLKVALGDTILTASFDTMLSFLEDEFLSYVKPIEFFDLIVRWVYHDLDRRSDFFHKLFAVLKLNLMNTADISRVLEEKLVAHCYSNVRLTWDCIRQPTPFKDVIVFGGIRKSSKHYGYLVAEKRWIRLPFFEDKHIRDTTLTYASAVIDDELYIVHQVDAYKAPACLFKLNQEKGCWEQSHIEDKEGVFSCADIYKHKLALSCGPYICLISCLRPRWSHTHEAYLQLIPTQPGFEYKRVRIPHFHDDAKLQHIAACSVQDHTIFIVGIKMKHTLPHYPSFSTVCVCYNIKTGTFTDCSKGGAKFGPLVYSDDSGKVFIHSLKEEHYTVFNLATLKWSTTRFSIMPPQDMVIDPVSMTTIHKGNIYTFSVREAGDEYYFPKPRHPYVFNIETQTWNKLPQSPMEFSRWAVPLVMKLPSTLVTCPRECPHCRAKQPYNAYPDEDRVSFYNEKTFSEEEEEYAISDDSDSVYYDHDDY